MENDQRFMLMAEHLQQDLAHEALFNAKWSLGWGYFTRRGFNVFSKQVCLMIF